MWPLFKLLFSANYWRMLFRGDMWRSTWVALRRAHKDHRSWKQFARTLYLLLVPVSVVVLIAGIGLATISGAAISLIWGFILFMGFLSRIGFGKAQKKPPVAPNDPNVNRALGIRDRPVFDRAKLRTEIGDLALLHALLADRAGSENFLRTKVLPEGVEVITRRLQLDALRDRGLYDRLGDIERDLLILPDGHWTEATSHDLALALEPLRLLRWVLRIDHYLPSIGDCLILNFKQSHEIATDPAIPYRGDQFISIESLNIAYRDAQGFLNRCYAEAVHRGLMPTDDEEQAERTGKIVEQYKHNEQKDLLLGPTIVSKAEDYLVLRARLLAARRSAVLSYIAKRMYNDIPAPESLQAFFLR